MTQPTELDVPPLTPEMAPAIRAALLRYRVMAYLVGVLLVVLCLLYTSRCV